jgi:uncharacterized SAM-binding protein YcdF (DUF218 family)
MCIVNCVLIKIVYFRWKYFQKRKLTWIIILIIVIILIIIISTVAIKTKKRNITKILTTTETSTTEGIKTIASESTTATTGIV